MASLTEIMQLLQTTLKPHLFSDYCPNGLQVEGKPEVLKIVSGVTASLALIEAARDAGATLTLSRAQFDALVLGLPWQRIGEAGVITVL